METREEQGWSLSKEVFDWINNNLPEGKTILQLGSGFDAFELSKKYKVFAVEHDENWVGKFPAVNYIFAPLVHEIGTVYWYDSIKLQESLPKEYDLIIIDGPVWDRRGLLRHLDLFKWNILIIVDDTHRDHDALIASTLSTKLRRPVNMMNDEVKGKQFTIIEML